MTDLRPKMSRALWECVHCGNTVMTVPEKTSLTPPLFCPCLAASGRTFVSLKRSEVEMQYGQMQDFIERVVGSSTPAHVDLWFEDDLTNIVTPGEVGAFGQFSHRRASFRMGRIRRLRSSRRTRSHSFLLSTEELATIFHLPTVTVRAPTMTTVESREFEPPVALPWQASIPTWPPSG